MEYRADQHKRDVHRNKSFSLEIETDKNIKNAVDLTNWGKPMVNLTSWGKRVEKYQIISTERLL